MSFEYTAVIVEPRKHKALQFVLENAIECLSDQWKIVLFHGTLNKEYCEDIVHRMNASNRIQIVQLPVENLNQKTYSELFATKSILYDFIQTEYFLIFQTDSMMFKRHSNILDSFLNKGYDYVGAPWLICNYPPTKHRGFIGNGGFSLRNTRKMLEIIEKYNWYNVEHTEVEWIDDLFFTNHYTDIVIQKPTYDEAKLFSVEEVLSPITFACHKPWLHSHYSEFVKLYPEVDALRLLQE